MKKIYISLKIAVIAGIFCTIGKALELTDKEADPYLNKGFIKLKEEEATETTVTTTDKEPVLTVTSVAEMDYNALKVTATTLGLETKDQKADTLREAIIAHIEAPVKAAE